MHLVSVIVPIYNAHKWLRLCVDSVLSQTYTNLEIILVDDGSTDLSSEICDDYAKTDQRITVIHKKNGGLSSARNAGIDVATGQLITFVDADDELHPEMIAHLLNVHQQTHADICCGQFIRSSNHQFKALTNAKFKVYCPSKAIELTLYQKKGFANSACNTLYNTKLFSTLRFTEGIGYEDLDFFYKIYAKANKIGYTNCITYFYRNNSDSYLNTWSTSRLDVLMVVDNIVNYMDSNASKNLQRAAIDRCFSAYYNIFVLANIHQEADIIRRCWGTIKRYRISTLLNPHVRLKNKLGALLSYGGLPLLRLASRFYF
jgi:glycosyltransferase involved in cell wall biosynthesis